MGTRRWRKVGRAVAALAVLAASAGDLAAQPRYDALRLVAPAAPGGGWDQTARAMQQVLQRTGLVGIAPVENIPGAAGTIGLARFVSAERGRADTLMVSGLIMLAAVMTHQSPVTLGNATPIARLVGEYEVVAVPTASPFRTLADLIAAFRARPESIAWGGGSAGGTDQILAGLIADAVGIAPARVNYIAFSGGGEMLASLLGQQLSVAVNGYAELQAQVEAGAVRILGVSSDRRVAGIDAPTLREQGVPVELVNWRSVIAPPGISSTERRRLEGVVEAMVGSAEWRALLDRYRWIDTFLAGAAFERFVEAEEARIAAILRKLRPEASTAPRSSAPGPYPTFVLLGLLVTGLVAARDLRRTSRHDPPRPRGPWAPVGIIAAGMALNVLLLESAGFIVASAVLCWMVARAFDRRNPWTDAAVAAGLALVAYVLFVWLLKLSLPAGWLFGGT